MFSDEIKKLLVQVITSWQVLVVTVVLILYVFVVNYVARLYHHRPQRSGRPPQPKAAPQAQETQASAVEPSDSDELDLEEKDEEK